MTKIEISIYEDADGKCLVIYEGWKGPTSTENELKEAQKIRTAVKGMQGCLVVGV